MAEKPRSTKSTEKKVAPDLDLKGVVPPVVESSGPDPLLDIDQVVPPLEPAPGNDFDLDAVLGEHNKEVGNAPAVDLEIFPDLPRPAESAQAPEGDSLGIKTEDFDKPGNPEGSLLPNPSEPKDSLDLAALDRALADQLAADKEDQSMDIKFAPTPARPPEKPYIFPKDPSAPERDSSDPIEVLNEQIDKEIRLLKRDERRVFKEGDEGKLKDLEDRLKDLLLQRELLKNANEKPAPEPIIEPAPVVTPEPAKEPAPVVDVEPAPQPEPVVIPEPASPSAEEKPVVPAPKKAKAPGRKKVAKTEAESSEAAASTAESQESTEPKTFEEVLKLQEEAFSARRDMIRFRKGKKVESLSKKDQAEYKRLKELSTEKRKIWMAELGKLPEEQQEESKDLTKLKEVQDRLAAMTPEQVTEEAIDAVVDTYDQELASLEAQIAEMDRLIKYDEDTVRGVTALGNKEDLRELKNRQKALLARRAASAAEQNQSDPAGTAQIRPEPAPVPEPIRPLTPEAPPVPPLTPENEEDAEAASDVLDYERAQAEARARRIEILRAAINEIDRRIIEKVDEHSKTSTWGVMDRLRISREIRALRKEHARLDREMNERKGFGTKFKDAAAKAYRFVKNKFKKDKSVGIGDLRGVSEATNASSEDIERVEAEARGEPVIDEKGSWKKWIKQRLGGAILGGAPEYITAERFRRGTKDVGQETSSLSRLIQKEENLSLEDAHDEYLRIKQEMAIQGIETSTDDRVLDISAEITAQKIVENDATIDDIVVTEIDKLEKKLKTYKGDFGQDVLTEENKGKIATEMKARLQNLRSGEGVADAKEMAKMLRENLDEKWWRRYAYGAVETILAGLLIKWVGSKLLAGKAKEAVATKGAGAASQEIAQIGLKDTIWGEAKRQLVSHGVSNPTNAQIQQVAAKFAKDSGVKVVAKGGELLWPQTAAGLAKDIALGKGFMIKMAGGLKEIAAIKSGLVAGVL